MKTYDKVQSHILVIRYTFITALVATSALKSSLRQQLQTRISIKAGMMYIDMYLETVIALNTFYANNF